MRVERNARINAVNSIFFIVQPAVGDRVEYRCRQNWWFTANEPEMAETERIKVMAVRPFVKFTFNVLSIERSGKTAGCPLC